MRPPVGRVVQLRIRRDEALSRLAADAVAETKQHYDQLVSLTEHGASGEPMPRVRVTDTTYNSSKRNLSITPSVIRPAKAAKLLSAEHLASSTFTKCCSRRCLLHIVPKDIVDARAANLKLSEREVAQAIVTYVKDHQSLKRGSKRVEYKFKGVSICSRYALDKVGICI